MVETAPCRARPLLRPADRWEEGPFAERFRCRPHRVGRFGPVGSEDPAHRCSRRCPGRAIRQVGLVRGGLHEMESQCRSASHPGLPLAERGSTARSCGILPGVLPPAGGRWSTYARVRSSQARGVGSFARLIPRAITGPCADASLHRRSLVGLSRGRMSRLSAGGPTASGRWRCAG